MTARRRARAAGSSPEAAAAEPVAPAAPAGDVPVPAAWADGYRPLSPEEMARMRTRYVTDNVVGGLAQYAHWHHTVRRREWGVSDPDAPVGAVLQ